MDRKTKREIEKIRAYSQKDWYYSVNWYNEEEKKEEKEVKEKGDR